MGRPDKMSEHDYQEQLRRERKKPRRQQMRTDEKLVNVVFVLTPKAKRADAYDSLETSETLVKFARRYKYHEPRQLATMAGRLELEMPESLIGKLKQELTPGWKLQS